MLHKNLQTDIVRENCLPTRNARVAVHSTGHVRCGRVQLGEKEPRLTSTLIADNVARNWETVNEEFLVSARMVSILMITQTFASLTVPERQQQAARATP